MALPSIDINDLLKKVQGVFDGLYGFLVKLGLPCWIALPVAAVSAASLATFAYIIGYVLQLVVNLGAWFAASILTIFTKVRTENPTAFNEVIAAALGDLLGIEVAASSLPGGQGPNGVTQRMQAIGGALHGLLKSEFLPGGPITPEQGQANAEKFSGFAINFSSASAFISILTEAASIGFVKNVRELGENMAESIGLGRLQRLALQPLIRNTIQQPTDLYYRKMLRPDRLSEAQVVQALRAGNITEDAARDQLAEKGYRDEDIAILLDQLTAKISANELEKLIRYSVIDQAKAIERLTNLGMDQADATLILTAADEARGDSQVSTILSNLEKARLDGFIDQNEFDGLLGELPLGTEEERLFRKRVADQIERPRTTISFAELKTAVVKGITDFSYVDTWLQNKGYGDTDQLILTFEIIEALATADAKKAAKAAKAAALQAAGKPVPAALTA